MRGNKIAGSGLLLLLTGCSLIIQGTRQKVEVSSEPDGASFKVAGQEHRTRTTVDLPKKEVTLTFSMAGYEDAAVTLKLRPSGYFYMSLLCGVVTAGVDWISGAWMEFDTDKVHVKLRPKSGAPVEKEIAITSTPEGASVEIDGVSYGRTNARFRLTWRPVDGDKQVALRLEGYEEMRLPLRRDSPTVDVKLVPKAKSGVAKFDSVPAGAEIWVDGVLAGQTPKTEKYDWLPDTPAKNVEFRLAGYLTESRKLTRDASTLMVQLKEGVETVAVKVESVPAGAAVEVDGARAMATPAEIRLDWSVKTRKFHTLKFIRAGYQSEVVRVEEAQKQVPVTVRLRPLLPRMP